MPPREKQELQEQRFDFRGGLNTHTSPPLLQPNELSTLLNCSVELPDGSIKMRQGSRRLHTTALGSDITGVFQWDAPGGKQLVAISGGDIHYKTDDFGNFSTVSPTPTLDTDLTSFATMRQDTSGAPLRLYFADGSQYWRWDGSALTQLDGTSSLPAQADIVRTYHVRNFLHTPDYEQHVFWSVLGDPEDGTVGLRSQGGSAMVDVLRGEAITAMEVVGSSLLIGTPNSIVRFTGYDSLDIQIGQDTEGVSAVVGPLGKNCLTRVERFAAMLATTGLYAVTEEDAILISEKINTTFRALDRLNLPNSAVMYHEGRREIWFAVPGASDGGANRTVLVYHLDLGSWNGLHSYPFDITCLGKWSDSNGDEYVVAGCADGYVRVLDYPVTGTLIDDRTAADTGGSAVTAVADLSPIFFNVGPGLDKTIHYVTVHAIIPSGNTLDVLVDIDEAGYGNSRTINGESASPKPYQQHRHEQGDRFDYEFTWTDPDVEIRGVTVRGWNMQRPSG